MDPDSYSEYGSTKVLNTDPIWIRIHNTAYQYPTLTLTYQYTTLTLPYQYPTLTI